MGNDGGTIPSRSEILNFNKRKLDGDSGGGNEVTGKELDLWKILGLYTYCGVSHKRLSKPIVSDYKGNLYNKEAILENLIRMRSTEVSRSGTSPKTNDGKQQKSKLEVKDEADTTIVSTGDSSLSHIRSLKDVVELQIEYSEEKGTIRCPLSGDTFDIRSDKEESVSKLRFYYVVPCGCTFGKEIFDRLMDVEYEKKGISRKRYIEMKCPVCGTVISTRDVIEINPRGAKEMDRLEDRMSELSKLGLTHSLKKLKGKGSKKHRKQDTGDGKVNGKDRHPIKRRKLP
ncbi:DEKNAAC103470 [Brettanomyces naardenensis]|uniref:DEKNAAC103471 n=1 Tax=Brettanomyces naardenensis TaxID=13370 RepID=A0A448YNB3_BRENA|nr:DEKNAAC103470 [Brettanomyces naardenensis]